MSLSIVAQRRLRSVWPYVQIARVDHWFKNAFMLLGVMLAAFYDPATVTWASVQAVGIAVLATCLVASSNYVLNELLDGERDRLHPLKRHRPVPSGRIRPAIAYAEWLVLAVAGVGLALSLNLAVFASALLLWVMGLAYNVPPVRMKEWPYLDVLSESVNNPIRLLLGWFVLIAAQIPPLSIVIACWMAGGFFMAMKRCAEFRSLGERRAAAHRRSLGHYTEARLLVSVVFYAATAALFAGIFIVRYHLELILFTPFAAGIFAYYLYLGMLPDSPVQNPEKLYRQRGFLAYMLFSTAVFVLLMFTSIPVLYGVFNVEPARMPPLWTLGGGETSAPPRPAR